MSADNRVVLDYTSRDYKAIRSMLVGLAQGFTPEWTTVGETGDFGTLLLELMAYNGDVMNYYIDRVGAEAFLGTAARRQSVMFIADMLSYVPTGQQAARVPLTFSWQWDSASYQIANTVYSVAQYGLSNNVITLGLASADSSVSIEVGQTITLTNIQAVEGVYVVQSTTPASGIDPFRVTINLPDTFNLPDLPMNAAPPGITVVSGSVVVVPKGTIVSSVPDDLGQAVVFELEGDVTLDSNAATKVPTPGYTGDPAADPSTLYAVTASGTALEGSTVNPTSIGISKGVPNADLVLSDIGVIDDTVKVFTKEGGAAIVWTRIDNLAVAGPDQSVFSYYVDDQGQTHILFGDNASGRVPPVNSEIFVGYRVGVGVRANDLDIGTVTNLNSDYASSQGVTVSNTASPSGGSDVESIESMRFSIPRATAVRRRAVNLDDYKSLALQVPGVTKAVAYGDSYTMVFLRIAGSDQSRALIIDRTPNIQSGNNSVTVVTDHDHSGDLHPNDNIHLSTPPVTGAFQVTKVWEAQPTNPIGVINKQLFMADGDSPYSVAKLKCATPHGLLPGQPVQVTGLGSPFDGIWVVSSVSGTDRSEITYVCTTFGSDGLPTTIGTPIASTAVASGVASLSAFSGLALAAPGVASNPYQQVDGFALGETPNLTYNDPQMKSLIAATEAYLGDKDLVGATVYAEPVEWTNVTVQAKVTVRDLYNRTAVRDAVKAAISGVFDFDNVDFGQRVAMGEVYRAALAVDGVEFVNISSMYIEDPAITTGYTPPIDLSDLPPDAPIPTPIPVSPGVLVPAVESVGDIVTPAYSIPRLSLDLIEADTWVTATGGLVNT